MAFCYYLWCSYFLKEHYKMIELSMFISLIYFGNYSITVLCNFHMTNRRNPTGICHLCCINHVLQEQKCCKCPSRCMTSNRTDTAIKKVILFQFLTNFFKYHFTLHICLSGCTKLTSIHSMLTYTTIHTRRQFCAMFPLRHQNFINFSAI